MAVSSSWCPVGLLGGTNATRNSGERATSNLREYFKTKNCLFKVSISKSGMIPQVNPSHCAHILCVHSIMNTL